MTPLLSHLIFWSVGLAPVAVGVLLNRTLKPRPCELASDHLFYDGVCDRCGAVACRFCGGEGTVYASYRDRVEGGGKDCWDCKGTGVAR